MNGRIARAPLRLLHLGGVRRVMRPLLRQRASVFMLHRFRIPDLGLEGHDPATVKSLLAFLRREGFHLATLRSVFEALRHGEPLNGAIAFSIDDGYADQAHIAGPLFAEFDCPVSTFLCTGFLDGQFWMWWDRVEYILEHTQHRQLDLLGVSIRWGNEVERRREQDRVVAHIKLLPEVHKGPFVDALAEKAEVELPSVPPARYAPMTWDDARNWEARGMSFGPHTLTHAILSAVDADVSHREIDGSRQRVEQELRAPDPIFCYPNGQASDFGERECGILTSLGFEGAVVGQPGYAEAGASPDWLFRIRRFALPNNRDDLLQCVSGFEHLKERLRARP